MQQPRKTPNGIKKEEKRGDKGGTKHDSDSDDEVCKSILVLGAPGVGKSNFCNLMIDGRASGRFVSSTKCVGGVTTELKRSTNHALNIPSNQKVSVIDMPGFGDPDLPL